MSVTPCGHETGLVCPTCWEAAFPCRHPADALAVKGVITNSGNPRRPGLLHVRLITAMCTRCGSHVQLSVPLLAFENGVPTTPQSTEA